MAVPSTLAKIIRDTWISQGFTPSTAVEGFDTDNSGRLHKQFFLTGPRAVETVEASREANVRWEMDVQFAWQPFKGGDADRFRFDLADAISDLHNAVMLAAITAGDHLSMASTDPAFNEDTKVWEVLVVHEFWTARSVAA